MEVVVGGVANVWVFGDEELMASSQKFRSTSVSSEGVKVGLILKFIFTKGGGDCGLDVASGDELETSEQLSSPISERDKGLVLESIRRGSDPFAVANRLVFAIIAGEVMSKGRGLNTFLTNNKKEVKNTNALVTKSLHNHS